jgi:hypothetical protein
VAEEVETVSGLNLFSYLAHMHIHSTIVKGMHVLLNFDIYYKGSVIMSSSRVNRKIEKEEKDEPRILHSDAK